MSYDLVVFEKRKMPANLSEFPNWYRQKIECESLQDISYASDKLQDFFHSVQYLFRPFAPDDNQSSENPKREEYLCDYDIKEDFIYMTFSYSVSEFAYDTIKRAAYFADVAFYNPNINSLPILFESRFPMLLEGEWFHPIEVNIFTDIRDKLNHMTVKNRSYLYVTDPFGNYIQIGGYGDSFTVEKRIYTDITNYVHTKAGYLCTENPMKEGYVTIAGNRVALKQNQILTMATAEQLFSDFIYSVETVDTVEWVEINV